MITAERLKGTNTVRIVLSAAANGRLYEVHFDHACTNDWDADCIVEKSREALDGELKADLAAALGELYRQCKHGNKRHRNWLRRKFDAFAAAYRP